MRAERSSSIHPSRRRTPRSLTRGSTITGTGRVPRRRSREPPTQSPLCRRTPVVQRLPSRRRPSGGWLPGDPAAQESDPLSLAINTTCARPLLQPALRLRGEAAHRGARDAKRISPSASLARTDVPGAENVSGGARAIPASVRQARRLAGCSRGARVCERHLGPHRRGEGDLANLGRQAQTRFVTAYGVALIYASVGEKGLALAWLEKAFAERSHWLVWLRLDPRWDPIRGDPRFEEMLSRVGLPTSIR